MAGNLLIKYQSFEQECRTNKSNHHKNIKTRDVFRTQTVKDVHERE